MRRKQELVGGSARQRRELHQIAENAIRTCFLKLLQRLRAGRDNPDRYAGGACSLHIDAHVADVKRLRGTDVKPLECGQQHIGRRLGPRHVVRTEHFGHERAQTKRDDQWSGERRKFVAADGDLHAKFVQSLESLARSRQKMCTLDEHRRMMLPIEIDGAFGFNSGHNLFEQIRQTTADVRFNLVLRKRRQPVDRADMIDAGGDRGIAVGQCAVKVEDHRANGHRTQP